MNQVFDERYNSFNLIHKGLRALLFETGIQLMRTDFTDDTEGAKAIRAVRTAADLFNDHALHEDTHILPAVAQFDPSLQQEFEEEHEEDEELANKLSALCEQYIHALSTERRGEIGKQLLYTFYEFAAFNLYHMNKEEKKLNAALWENYSDQDIQAIQQKIVASISPEIMALDGKWMMRGINDAEAKGWLTQVRHNAPDPVFRQLLAVGEKELGDIRWNRVEQAVL
ncbi:MAG TPA: hemerythrin domain-containing protein [Flavitalea sp.]|nr:hemerythrin domain-containing protein [Flavitalea sp.]